MESDEWPTGLAEGRRRCSKQDEPCFPTGVYGTPWRAPQEGPTAAIGRRPVSGAPVLLIHMPLELQIIRASEFIRLGAHGHFDLAASKAALAVLARACRKRGIDRALMDLRALQPGPKPVFSRDDLIALVNTFHEVGFTRQQRLAILYRSDPHHRARLFAFLSTVRGWTVRAFDDFEKALSWISSGPEAARPARSAAEKLIPVRTSARKADPAALPVMLRKPLESAGPKTTAAARRPGPSDKPVKAPLRRPILKS